MKILLIVPTLLFLIITTTIAQEISKHQADDLIATLSKNVPDKLRMATLLQLASFNVLKEDATKSALDSADTYIQQAVRLNYVVKSKEASGNILLLKGYLAKKKGSSDKKLFVAAIETLELSGDKFHLAMTNFELAKFYSGKIPAKLPEKVLLQDRALLLLQQSGTIEQKKYGLKEAQKEYVYSVWADIPWQIKFLQELTPIIHQINDKQREVDNLHDIADLYIQQGNAAIAEKELLQVIRDFQGFKDIYLMNIYDMLAGAYHKMKNNKKALFFELQALKGTSATDFADLENFYSRLSDIYVALKMNRESDLIQKKILEIFSRPGRSLKERLALRDVVWTHLANTERLPLYVKELLSLLESCNGKEYQINNLYDELAKAYQLSGNYKEALRYGILSLKATKTVDDSAFVEKIYSRLANTYFDLDMKHEAIDVVKLLDNLYIRGGKFDQASFAARQIASLLVLEDKALEGLNYITEQEQKYPPKAAYALKIMALGKARCYEALKQIGKANKYIDQALYYRRLEEEHVLDPDFNTDYLIGGFYARTGQYEKAKSFLKNALNETDRENTSNSVRKIYYYQFQIDSAAGNSVLAIKSLQLYQRLNDSAFNLAKNREIQELSIAYGTEQTKKDIKLLQNKEKLQKAQIFYAEKLRNWIIAASGMLLLLLGVSFNRYRLKQRSNKQLQKQRKEIIAVNENLNNLVLEKDILIVQKDQLITEKQWLLKEVHHRVKNNLHTVICLLESQAIYLENDALKAIESSQHRIYAMSLIHQKLYQSDDIKTIDMSFYMPEFIQYLNESFGTERHVRFHLEIETIQLGVSQAIPLALIVNEAVTNSIKYAFKPDSIGVISIAMFQKGEYISLIIADNGIGIDPAVVDMPLESLGLKLMNGLSEDINAHIQFENDKGTRITIVFNVDPLHERNEFLLVTEGKTNL